MSSEWPVRQISDVVEFNPKRLIQRGSVAPFVDMASVPELSREIASIQEREFKGSGSRFQNGDTIFARITPCLENGKTALVTGLPDNNPAHGSTEFIVMAAKDPDFDKNFVYYLARSPEFRNYAIQKMEGTSGRQRVSWQSLAEYQARIPPKEERKAIGELLASLDDRIALLRETNATLEALAQAIFKSWFVDFDPVHAKAEGRMPEGMDEETAALFPDGFEESELGLIPRGWEVSDIYQISEVRYGAPFSSKLFNSDGRGVPLVRIRDLKEESPGVSTPEVHPKGYKIQPGDIVVGMDGEFRAYLWGGEEAWMNQRVCAFHPINGHSGAFVRSSIAAPLARIEATATATTVIHLGKKDIDKFRVLIPSDAVAQEFSEICDPLYEKIVSNKQMARSLASLRDTLLPRLISGKLRLPEAEAIVEEAL